MAQLILQHLHQARQLVRLYCVFQQIGRHPTGVLRVHEWNFLPCRQIGKNTIRRAVGLTAKGMADLAATPQQRHHLLQTQLAVKVSAAQAQTIAGQNVDLGLALLAKQGKIRRTTPDIHNQSQITGMENRAVGQGGGLRFGHELNIGKTRRQITFAQINLSLGIAPRIGAVKQHRAA